MRLQGQGAAAGSPRGEVWTIPIKGTRPRGLDVMEDARLMAGLDADPKERAEPSMVVDVERNDLGRVASRTTLRQQPPLEVEDILNGVPPTWAVCCPTGNQLLLHTM